jgi:hypothetical protein
VKLLLYVAGGFVAMALAALLITRGQAPDSNPLILLAFVGTLFHTAAGGILDDVYAHPVREAPLAGSASCFYSIYLLVVLR